MDEASPLKINALVALSNILLAGKDKAVGEVDS